MRRNRTSVSKATSYREIGDYWDDHDLSRIWGRTKKVKFDVQIDSEATLYAVEKGLSEKVQSLARRRGVSSATLINLWIQEKLREQVSR